MRKMLLALILSAFYGGTAAMAQSIGGIELTLIRTGTVWKAVGRINAPGRQSRNAIRNLKVNNNEVAFATTMLALELRFNGKLTGDGLSGTVEGFQGGSKTQSGTWVAMQQKTGRRGGGLAGTWIGTFSLSAMAQPAAPATALVFDPNVANPAYPNAHPQVLFDEAHNNADTSSGRYKPFSDLITSDGYSVRPARQKFSQSALQGQDVLVIVNASGPSARRDAPSLTDAECDAVREWVDAGGALLLITDHAPYSAAVGPLAKRFGIDVTIGHTFDTTHYNKETNDQTELLFTRENGLLGEHPITRGRDDAERINRVLTFSGTSVKGSEGSVPLLKLSGSAMDVLPPDPKPSASPDDPPADHKAVSAAGRAQGLALQFGKGRVVIVAEAAALTAQIAPSGFLFGMNVAGIDNRQFALNIMHWLSGLLK
ncbi:MAG: hypothetical protein AABN34_04525 [Acidobacteriota bacterium]